jgi:hypothetical protein
MISRQDKCAPKESVLITSFHLDLMKEKIKRKSSTDTNTRSRHKKRKISNK